MLLPRREIKWSEKYKLRPLLSRLVGALQATLLTNKEKKQQMENKCRRTKKEVKTEFTTAVMLLPARLRQFNGSLICFCDPAIVSAYIQTSGSLKLFFYFLGKYTFKFCANRIASEEPNFGMYKISNKNKT